jgi:hypothetical protein
MRDAGLSPQAQYGVDRYRLDFAFPELSLGVEADGNAWHDASRDARRDEQLANLGWKILRFSGSSIHRDAEGCAQEIKAECQRLSQAKLRYTAAPRIELPPPARSWWRKLLERLSTLFRSRSPVPDSATQTTEETPSAGPLPSWLLPLDESQRRAVQAGAGVVQAIAPAGSGKTAVLVARAKELVSLGAPANRILCLTFNRAAAEQLRSRLNVFALEGVEVRSFHALGRAILKDAELLRGQLRATTFAEWRWLAREAMRGTEDGVWIEPADAQDHISQLKLAELVTAGEYNVLLSRSSPLETNRGAAL